MTKTTANIRFKARLLRPAERPKGSSWTFLVLPRDASAKLPTRGRTTVGGIINGHPFAATLEPDGQKSHWLTVNKKLREAAGVAVGDVVPLNILSIGNERESRVPVDLRTALTASPEAMAVWSDLTTNARSDWIHWITSARRPETRARRVHNACEMLGAGKRRVCCFDRSGIYGKGLRAPRAAE